MMSTNPAQQKENPKHKDRVPFAMPQRQPQFTIIMLYLIGFLLQTEQDLEPEFTLSCRGKKERGSQYLYPKTFLTLKKFKILQDDN